MSIIPEAKKNLDSLTKLERERELRRLRGEQEDLIDAMGQDSDKKAAPIVNEYVNELNKKEQLLRQIDIEQLKKRSNNKRHYQRYLISTIERFVKEESIPKTYTIYAESDDVGIVVGIENTNYQRAIKICGIPFYDLHACKVLAAQIGNTIARLEGHFERTDSNIIIADKDEMKIALQTNGRQSNKSGT